MVFEERENWSTRKTSQSREENQQQTQPTYDAGSGNQTRDTLVGGEHSQHCTIPAPLLVRGEKGWGFFKGQPLGKLASFLLSCLTIWWKVILIIKKKFSSNAFSPPVKPNCFLAEDINKTPKRTFSQLPHLYIPYWGRSRIW